MKTQLLAPSMAICLLIAGATPLAAEEAGPTTAEYGVVLNLSGKQRMLTQKMNKAVKLYEKEAGK